MSVQPMCHACHDDGASRDGCAEHAHLPGHDYKTKRQDEVLEFPLNPPTLYDRRIREDEALREAALLVVAAYRMPQRKRYAALDTAIPALVTALRESGMAL